MLNKCKQNFLPSGSGGNRRRRYSPICFPFPFFISNKFSLFSRVGATVTNDNLDSNKKHIAADTQNQHFLQKAGFDYITITGGNYNLIKDLKRSDDPKKCEYFYQQFVLNIKNHLTRTKLFMNGGFVLLSDMICQRKYLPVK
ncbi:unnamed protein product [Gongylonema pulchrum]|uniref:Uncharacterized protein n=1 Tax=Gongylonema pulchrum TaxID=637853 RepID=A0A3P7NX92_9BILA|nr:unnamed protein product [Gongylonema pulchrum]